MHFTSGELEQYFHLHRGRTEKEANGSCNPLARPPQAAGIMKRQPFNTSPEHHALSQLPAKWLRGRAFAHRGSTEIRVAPTYKADYVGIGGFQRRFKEEYWHQHHCDPLMRYEGEGENRRYAPKRNIMGILIFEVKVSRADFLSTFGPKIKNSHANRHHPVGSFHWIVTPKGLVEPEEVPTFWGLLETSGNGLREMVKPYWFEQPEDLINRIAYEILWYGNLG